MQLFISDNFIKNNDKVIIKEKRIVDQLRKVLRAKTWYKLFLQNKTWNIVRYELELKNIWKEITLNIINIQENQESPKNKWIIQSILNKASKMELIVQKLTEIWVPKIYFIATKRSVFKDIKWNKFERLKKIALEAAEQSFSWYLPEIKIFQNIDEINWNKAILDFEWENYKNVSFNDIDFLVIWPEWWFSKEDIEKIKPTKKILLWQKILRSETASIIWWFILMS